MKVSATSGLTRDELDRLVQAAKGRVIASTPKEEVPKKGGEETGKKQKAGTAAAPSPFLQAAALPEEQGETEFLTGDMINTFIKDPDEPSAS